MPRILALFSDGTGNSAAKSEGTNVRRLYEAVERGSTTHPQQITFYDDGVGTQSLKPLRYLGGAFGYGISENLRQLYGFLLRQYQPGDAIFLFGFSRGAFTARTLSNMLHYLGLPEKGSRSPQELDSIAAEALKAYKRRVPGDANRGAPQAFRTKYTTEATPIEMLGVWDTVEAVGFPIKEMTDALRPLIPLHFQQVRIQGTRKKIWAMESDLPPHVAHIYHALSIDDERLTFHPLLFDERNKSEGQVIEQVWFAGAHSNVGGGYPKDGLAYLALKWMADKAVTRGLMLSEAQLKAFSNLGDVDDHAYEPRNGLGVFYRYAP